MIEDYKKHAVVWDWDGYDNTPEFDYWCNYAAQFGKKVLIPMCALGQSGAYIAQKGFDVTAFDITEEMIYEGQKRFGSVKNLSLIVADICDFDFDEKDFDFAFIATQDLHLLPDMESIKKAFVSVASHMKKGACLALELILPSQESYEYPTRTFHPRVPNYTDKKVWKDGRGKYDAATKRHFIEQVVYIEDDKGMESFHYSIILQYYEREKIIAALDHAGFIVKGEFSNRSREPWTPKSREWIIEAIRR
ncbi:MAG: class I SAM-dependent methyltransferase [Eubacteriales bacterium]|nr:class I SAM-dependent methyltransferase [Eubacteriales bacterium]